MTAITSTQYRDLVNAPADGPAEVSSEQYRQIVGNSISASHYLPADKPHSSEVNTEPKGKTEFREWLTFATLHEVVEEHEGIPGRKFRFDWAIPSLMIAFEYDGVADHATRKGSERDAEKGNLAQLAGWLFIRLNARSIKDGTAYEHAEQAILKRLQKQEEA